MRTSRKTDFRWAQNNFRGHDIFRSTPWASLLVPSFFVGVTHSFFLQYSSRLHFTFLGSEVQGTLTRFRRESDHTIRSPSTRELVSKLSGLLSSALTEGTLRQFYAQSYGFILFPTKFGGRIFLTTTLCLYSPSFIETYTLIFSYYQIRQEIQASSNELFRRSPSIYNTIY